MDRVLLKRIVDAFNFLRFMIETIDRPIQLIRALSCHCQSFLPIHRAENSSEICTLLREYVSLTEFWQAPVTCNFTRSAASILTVFKATVTLYVR